MPRNVFTMLTCHLYSCLYASWETLINFLVACRCWDLKNKLCMMKNSCTYFLLYLHLDNNGVPFTALSGMFRGPRGVFPYALAERDARYFGLETPETHWGPWGGGFPFVLAEKGAKEGVHTRCGGKVAICSRRCDGEVDVRYGVNPGFCREFDVRFGARDGSVGGRADVRDVVWVGVGYT